MDPPTQGLPTQDVAGGGGGPADRANTQGGHQDTARGRDGAYNETQTESSLKKAPLAVCGDAACGAGVLLAKLEVAEADIAAKVQFSVTPGG